MLEKLDAIDEKYGDLERRMQEPEVYTDPALYAKLAREQKEITPVVEAYRKYRKAKKETEDACALMNDPELKQMAQEDFEAARAEMEQMEQEIKLLLLPKDPNDHKNVIIEIRGGRRRRRGPLCLPARSTELYHVCRVEMLENRNCQHQRDGTGRHQGSELHHRGGGRILA